MTDEHFCENDSTFYGELINDISQIGERTFDGKQLKNYVEHHIHMANKRGKQEIEEEHIRKESKENN